MISSVLTDDLNLVGRDVESKLLDTVLGRPGDGGGALVFRGEPGIGKSALLDRARQRATACRTARSASACSSRPARSGGTCIGSSPSSTSLVEHNCETP